MNWRMSINKLFKEWKREGEKKHTYEKECQVNSGAHGPVRKTRHTLLKRRVPPGYTLRIRHIVKAYVPDITCVSISLTSSKSSPLENAVLNSMCHWLL